MIKIPIGRSIPVEWKIQKGDCVCKEDFGRVERLCLFLCGTKDKYVVSSVRTDSNVLKFDIPGELPEDVYCIEAIWWKDAHYKRAFSKVCSAFAVIDEAHDLHDGAKLKVTSHAETYGYDGLDSYEMAVFMGYTTLPRSLWVANLSEMNEREAIIQQEEERRKVAETRRESLEEARIKAEAQRDRDELTRKEAERRREENEKKRISDFTALEARTKSLEDSVHNLEDRVSRLEYSGESIKVATINFAEVSPIKVKAGEVKKLTIRVRPENATNKKVKWEVSDSGVLRLLSDTTYTANGEVYVQGISTGTCTITCTSDDGGITKTLSANVVPAGVLVERIELTGSEGLVLSEYGKRTKISAKIYPEDADNKELEWHSTNTDVVTVDENGNVTATGIGNASIECAAKDGSGVVTGMPIHVSKFDFVGIGDPEVYLEYSDIGASENSKKRPTVTAYAYATGNDGGQYKITSSYSREFTIDSAYATINSSTGEVTVGVNNTGERRRIGAITIKIKMLAYNEETGTQIVSNEATTTADIYQAAPVAYGYVGHLPSAISGFDSLASAKVSLITGEMLESAIESGKINRVELPVTTPVDVVTEGDDAFFIALVPSASLLSAKQWSGMGETYVEFDVPRKEDKHSNGEINITVNGATYKLYSQYASVDGTEFRILIN